MDSLRLGSFHIFLIMCLGLLLSSSSRAEAEKVDIKKETELYKKSLIDGKDYADISSKLESYQNYIDGALSILNKELEKNKQLYEKIEKYGKFEKNKVILIPNKDKELDEYSQYLKDNGIKIGYSEGSIYLYFDPMYVVRNFNKILPENITEFFRIEADDIQEGFEEDAALTIPWDYLRKKILRYEGYLIRMNNINCPYVMKLTRERIGMYLRAYMIGLENSRIYDYIDEARGSYERFLSENKGSQFYKVIESYYYDLRRNNFKFGEKEEIIGGNRYIGATIVDKNNKQVYVSDVVKEYLENLKLGEN